MNESFRCVRAGLTAWVLIMCLPLCAWAMTAQEIVDQAVKQGLGESFRISLTVKTFRHNKQIASKSLWLIGTAEKKLARFFMDFEEPADSKGLRFLLIVPTGEQPQAYMYMPATRKTLPLATDDPSVDLGGTGLTMDDVQVFVPKGGEKLELVKEEKVEGRECHVIRVTSPDSKSDRMVWIAKEGFLLLRSENRDASGKVERSFKVTEFFKTAEGREFPREEVIVIPERGIKIVLRQENAVFDVEIPDEILNAETFGTFKWKM